MYWLISAYRCTLARAVIATVAFAGMRRAELLGIRVQDVNLRAGEIHLVRTKGGKSLTVVPAPAALQAIREYLEVRHKDANTDKLFCIDRGRPLGTVGLRTLMRDVASAADIRS